MGQPWMYTTQLYIEFLDKASWNELLTDDEAKEFGFCGFYTKFFETLNLEVIVLNTNLYYKTNITETDPCNQVNNYIVGIHGPGKKSRRS
jgi:hypothetical protein